MPGRDRLAQNLCLAAIDSVKMILSSMLISENCACPRRSRRSSVNFVPVHDAVHNARPLDIGAPRTIRVGAHLPQRLKRP
ncbi:MAG: hypothetical protein DWI12_08915 [Planctomycetota bacterium]|nr:MAG: hypothetical protein DWI12_08915 [Planctomycetota bacterium]